MMRLHSTPHHGTAAQTQAPAAQSMKAPATNESPTLLLAKKHSKQLNSMNCSNCPGHPSSYKFLLPQQLNLHVYNLLNYKRWSWTQTPSLRTARISGAWALNLV